MSHSRSTHSNVEHRVRELAVPLVEAMGLEVVEVTTRRAGRRWVLRVDVDRVGPEGVRIDDCERVSRALDPLLEAEDLFDVGYVLEVSSPGVERPIRTRDDVRRNTGRRVVIHVAAGVLATLPRGGIVRGTLQGAVGDAWAVRMETGEVVQIPEAGIDSAKQDVEFSMRRAPGAAATTRGIESMDEGRDGQ